MTKLTQTEGTILAELLLKVARGDEKLADEIVDVVYNMVSVNRSVMAATPLEQEKCINVSGW